jgi:hypothetical protein
MPQTLGPCIAGAPPVAHAAGAAFEAGTELYAVGVAPWDADPAAGAVMSARAAVPKIESRERVTREDVAVKVRMTGSPVVLCERESPAPPILASFRTVLAGLK